jgi:hypothetical protein
MRHPLSTSAWSGWLGEVAVAVGGMDGLVIEHALAQAVPQDLQPAVAQGSEGGVVGLAAGAVGVVRSPIRRRRGAVLGGPVLCVCVGRHPCGRRASGAGPLGCRLTSVLEGQAPQAFPGGDPMTQDGVVPSSAYAMSCEDLLRAFLLLLRRRRRTSSGTGQRLR